MIQVRFTFPICFSLLSLLKEMYAYMRSPSCLCVCPLSTSETIGKFYEIQYGGQAIEDDLKAISFHPVASTIPKWRTFKLLRWVQNFTSQCGPTLFRMVIDLQRMNNFSEDNYSDKPKIWTFRAVEIWKLQFIWHCCATQQWSCITVETSRSPTSQEATVTTPAIITDRQEKPWPTEVLLASQEGLCSVKLVLVWFKGFRFIRWRL
jgi:hypothetical protein